MPRRGKGQGAKRRPKKAIHPAAGDDALVADPLSAQQRRFVEEYLVDLNGLQAARRAGYAESNPACQAHRLLRNAHVAAAIQDELRKRGERTAVKADRVVLELARIAFSDIRAVATWTPDGLTWTPSDELDDEAASAIAEMTDKTTETGGGDGATTVRREQRVKMHDKLRALEMLGRHLGILTDSKGDGITLNLSMLPREQVIQAGLDAIKFLREKGHG